jgi:DNA uptake protein ComE-like DNA-binding protein
MKLSLIAFVMFALTGCAADVASSSDEATTDSSQLLAFVNYPDTDEALLDLTVKLDSRAAKNIIAARNGADGIYPSSDDVPFTSASALDAVPYVGSATIAKLQAYALAHPAPAGETVEGVMFSGWQSTAVAWGVNRATEAQLDAFLDSRAAKSLVAGRPFASVASMGPMTYVGASALAALRGHAATWWTASKAPGFVLDEATRANDAELLKESLAEDEGFTEVLAQIGGDNGEGVAIIEALETEIDVLTKPLVGTTYADADTAQAAIDSAAPVKGLTKSGQWAYLESLGLTPPTAMACIAKFEVAVIPELANLLFMSESDRPFDVVTFAGAGTKAPTAASVLALVNAQTGSTSELRATSDYFVAFEGDATATTAVQSAFGAELKDVVYVAVFAPPNTNNSALVDVYLVGRTSCGDLVGLHAIAVET